MRSIVAVVLGCAVLTACATELQIDEVGLPEPGQPVLPGPEPETQLDEPVSPETAPGAGAPSANEIIEAALADAERFWESEYPAVYGTPYQPISGGFWAYGPGTELPACGGVTFTYAEVADNAFYCYDADYVAWDEHSLMPDLYEQFGGFTLAIVMAHELGHAVQIRAEVPGPTIVLELQADCFAGAWTAHVDAGQAPSFELTLDDLDRAIAGFLELRDGIGTDALDPDAHGTGFDRVGAFQEGFEHGAEHCARYPEMWESGELVVVEVPFTDPADFERGGDLPLDETLRYGYADLEDFWSLLFEELGETWEPLADVVVVDAATDEVACGGDTFSGADLDGAAFYCIDDDTIYIEHDSVILPLYDIGDFAVITEMARLYAFAAQVRLGDLRDTLEANLQGDCYAGIYASSAFLGNRGDGQLVLSPGDLDEAVIAFLRTSDAASIVESGDASVGTAFQRFAAFRAGFMTGTEACDLWGA